MQIYGQQITVLWDCPAFDHKYGPVNKMTEQIWIKANGKLTGPGSVEQFLTALHANRIGSTFQFSTTGSDPWYSIVSFAPAAPAAAESNGWYLTKFGALSDSQHGPFTGNELVQQRVHGKIDGYAVVLHQLYTVNEWREFSASLLQFSFNDAVLKQQKENEPAEIQHQQEKEERRREKEEAKRQREIVRQEEAERRRRENEAREAGLVQHQSAMENQAAVVSGFAAGGIQSDSQSQPITPTSQQGSVPPPLRSGDCWNCNLSMEYGEWQCIYCRMIQ